MKIPLKVAKNLLLLLQGQILADSSTKHSVIESLIEENILMRSGRIKKSIVLLNQAALADYLQNHCGISQLDTYIEVLEKQDASRAELAMASADSKLKTARTFKGFLVNSYQPLDCSLNNEPFTLLPLEGTFTFIYDFESFLPAADATIVGIENAENFRQISKQKHLFNAVKPLFVCRYPQNNSRDLIKWLELIPNNYFHFGDYDLAGINIYVNEFKKHIPHKSLFFIPENIEVLVLQYGNKNRYNEQKEAFPKQSIEDEPALLSLLKLIHHTKKGLDQEVLIKGS